MSIQVGIGEEMREIAVSLRDGGNPGFFWLGGYRSDMDGTKAQALDRWCCQEKLSCCRFDYSGHGRSSGAFRDGTISRWLEESLTVFSEFAKGPQVLVGSSMGGWIALKMAQELRRRGEGASLHGLLLIAPAPDFTEELVWPKLSQSQRNSLDRDGYIEEDSQYSDEPHIYTKRLFKDGKRNLVLNGPIDAGCPVHILQGMADPDVPWHHALKLTQSLAGSTVMMTLVKEGDHRLSRPQDIALILRLAQMMANP